LPALKFIDNFLTKYEFPASDETSRLKLIARMANTILARFNMSGLGPS
jgi:hypothetical protein